MTNTSNNIASVMNTPTFVFTRTQKDPSILNCHPILGELGFAYNSDARYAEMMKYFGHYEQPVVDRDNNVIIHWPEVQAAVDNGKDLIDCFEVEFTLEQLRQFIFLKHRYHRMDLIASYNSVKFYEDYLNNTTDGVDLMKSQSKSIYEMIAALMHTSDSTVKRLKRIGDNKIEKLGMIEQGFLSFKEVIAEIKAERLAARTAERKAALQTQSTGPTGQVPVVVPAETYYTEPETKLEREEDLQMSDKYYEEGQDDDGGTEQNVETYYDNDDDKSGDSDLQLPAKPLFEDFNCFFSTEGLGQVEVNVTANVPTVIINGNEIRNLSYQVILDEKETTGTEHSFVIRQAVKNGFCIQLTIENFSKAA